ncbi:M17 family peptidase N-terminal domain-containing protein, partial [Klebsiella sp. 78128]|uniref:M17 family peptidase N-terminal domain-containing protein n=1 Tax=Klebsiella sp. 78128 TaxID=3079089 RepID=UPI00300481D5
AASERFKGKSQSAMTLAAPAGVEADRLVVVGLGSEKDRGKIDWTTLGGYTAGRTSGRAACAVMALPGLEASARDLADFCVGARLRNYS